MLKDKDVNKAKNDTESRKYRVICIRFNFLNVGKFMAKILRDE